MIKENYFVDLAKKELQKAIIQELCRKEVIDFTWSSTILKKLDEQIEKLKEKYDYCEEGKQITVQIEIS